MSEINFLAFDQVELDEFIAIVNEAPLRKHLIDHPHFDIASLKLWMEEKIKVDSMKGCRVRAVYIDGVLAGWCGIQPDNHSFEIAIVISHRFWGFGISIFKSLLGWAKEMDHKEVLFHLLDSRPEYKALKKLSRKVHKTELSGRGFTTYHIPITH